MTDLLSKTARDDLGISFWERGIIFASLLLKSSYTAPSKEPDIVIQGLTPIKIALTSKVVGTSLAFYCDIESRLPFNAPLAHELGGDYSGAVKEILKGTLAWKGKSLSLLTSEGFSVTTDGSGLPADPSWVTSLEKYLVWCVEQRIKELLTSNPTSTLPLTITPLEESTSAELFIKASIPINYSYYLANHSLIGSTLPISLIPGSGDGGVQIKLNDLSDVDVGTTQPENGFALISDGTKWIAKKLTAVTGGVSSVNGQTGTVLLDILTTEETAAAAPVQSVNGQTGDVTIDISSIYLLAYG